MSKNLCDSCRIHLLDCETAFCEIPRAVARACGSGCVTKCTGYRNEPAPKPPEVVQVATVEITHIGHEELGQESLRMKCAEAELLNRLRNAFPEADNVHIQQIQEFVTRDGE